jgi:hypothetical protein
MVATYRLLVLDSVSEDDDDEENKDIPSPLGHKRKDLRREGQGRGGRRCHRE